MSPRSVPPLDLKGLIERVRQIAANEATQHGTAADRAEFEARHADARAQAAADRGDLAAYLAESEAADRLYALARDLEPPSSPGPGRRGPDLGQWEIARRYWYRLSQGESEIAAAEAVARDSGVTARQVRSAYEAHPLRAFARYVRAVKARRKVAMKVRKIARKVAPSAPLWVQPKRNRRG